MFFIQGQLSENLCGYMTEVPAYYFLITQSTNTSITGKYFINLTKKI